eukprot:gene6727-7485_t
METENLQFDEKLSEAVRQFPCIYDKTKKDYKDININKNAWNNIAAQMDIENGERTKQLFENLKKRFSKRRLDLKKSERSGTSASAVQKAKENMKEYSFLAWLIPYIKLRATKTNLPPPSIEKATPSPTPTMDSCSIVDDNDNNEANFYEATMEEQLSDEEHGNCLETPRNTRKRSCANDISEVTGQQKWSKKKPDLDKEELRVLKSMQKAFEGSQEEPKKDDIDLFGMLVSAELRKLGEREQRIAKHQIQNVIFTMQMQAEDHSSLRFPPSVSLHQSVPFHQPSSSLNCSGSVHPLSPFNPQAPINHPASFYPTTANPSTWNAISQMPHTSQSFQVVEKSVDGSATFSSSLEGH